MIPHDLLHRGRGYLYASCQCGKIDLAGNIRCRMIEITAPLLHQQHTRYPGKLERGMVACRFCCDRQRCILLLQLAGKPVRLSICGKQLHSLCPQASQHIQLDIANNAAALLLLQGGHIIPGSALSVLFICKADKTYLSICRRIFHLLRDCEKGSHAGSIVIRAICCRHTVVVR